MINAYENATVLCEAIVLWKAGALPPSLERLFYDVLRSTCYMGTILLVKETKYRRHTVEWQQPDVQSMLLTHLLTKIKSTELKTDQPKQVINLLLRVIQNRLRDLHAYQDRRKNFVTTTFVDIDAAALRHSDMSGQIRTKPVNSKINTDNTHKET